MDHRCLYGHRVPAAFTFAIQNRTCPTCGAPTVTITGYQAARKLTTEVGLEAVTAQVAVGAGEGKVVHQPFAQRPTHCTPTGMHHAVYAGSHACVQD